VRIPLDYYRILGLPIQATAEQLQQAHRDRTLQLPRREFSEVAIEARKQLIDEAYSVLSNPSDRQDYDTSFLAKSYDLLEVGKASEGSASPEPVEQHGFRGAELDNADPFAPHIEIQGDQLVGALLILQDLGEYELVLKHSAPYLEAGNFALRQGRLGDPDIVTADIALTYALSCLELGREQWQQGQYENAAESLRSGQELLLRQGVFPNLRGEMQSDLYKLRPYRILELVALPEHQSEARQQGLDLLQDMLQDRNGIDGTGDDQSGLAVDDFLRFIQQLRSYLTAAEQQTLFELEARRPSPVALYLAVYALLARGFADRQPALIRRAKGMLLRLGTRQDVHLEQAVCALLLGQTEDASRALELSQEFESLDFIREHSQGAPDLLPGLCLYSERWLQNEVFPHFRDLSRKQASLKEYFADEDVQIYLEELPAEPESITPWSSRRSVAYRPATTERSPLETRLQPIGQGGEQGTEPEFPHRSTTTLRTSNADSTGMPEQAAASNGAGVYTAERTTPYPDEGEEMTGTKPRSPQRRPRNAVSNGTRSGTISPTHRPRGGSLRLDRVLLLGAIGVGAILLGMMFIRLLSNRPQSPPPATEGTSQQVEPLAPVLEQIIPQQTQVTTSATLDETSAATIIQSWLAAKAAAMGEAHEISELSNILTDPALSGWQSRAEQVQSSNSYWQYEHSDVEVTSVEMLTDSTIEQTDSIPSDTADAVGSDDAVEPDAELDTESSETTDTATDTTAAIVEATVTEQGSFYNNGQLDESSSYDDTLQVRYNLIRENGEWRIQDWQVLE